MKKYEFIGGGNISGHEVKMSNEDSKEKPEWLNDLQKGSLNLNLDENLDDLNLDGNLVKNVSVRYGRRTSACTKSVENSPTKDLFKDKRNCISARPLLTSADIKKDEDNKSLNKSIKLLEESLQRSLNVQTPEINKTNLEDSWSSLHFFNIKQKGRLNSEDDALNSSKFDKNSTSKKHLVQENNNPHPEEKVNQEEVKDFIIPELPEGKSLVFNIKTTWGDKHYLGLNGIEMFNSEGEKIKVHSVSLRVV